MQTECLRCEVEDFVATVTLDRPPVNAMNGRMAQEVAFVFDSLSVRDDVRVAILTGAGKCFCAGVDLLERPPDRKEPDYLWRSNRRGRECFNSILDCKVPVIAAINGPALGAGLAMVASSDILVASEAAVFGLPEIDVGMLGGGRHAMRLFPHSKARRMMFTGQRIPGPELLRLGVVEECVPAIRLLDAAGEIAREITEKSPLAVELAKDGMNAVELMGLRDGYRFEQNLTARLRNSDDAKEAVAAFREKRKPVFRGR